MWTVQYHMRLECAGGHGAGLSWDTWGWTVLEYMGLDCPGLHGAGLCWATWGCSMLDAVGEVYAIKRRARS